MEARLFKSNHNNDCDYLLVSLDEQSLTYLNDGSPVRVAFFIDNNENFPWYKRKYMVAIIGKDLDFERHKIYTKGLFRKGLVDKSYLIDYIRKLKQKLYQIAMQELEVFDKQLKLKDYSYRKLKDSKENFSEPLEVISEAVKEPKEYLNTTQASEILNISHCTLLKLAKQEKIKGEYNISGWSFIKSDIKRLLKEEPEFLKKIWNNARSYEKKGKKSYKLIFDNEVCLHIKNAEKILNLSDTTIRKYIKLGLIKYKKKDNTDYYIPETHIKELKANPPDWLKNSWRYFATTQR